MKPPTVILNRSVLLFAPPFGCSFSQQTMDSFNFMSNDEYASYADSIGFSDTLGVPDNARGCMDWRMGLPPCNEPPAPRHHVCPASLDLNLRMPQDNSECVDFISVPPVADTDATLRSAFRYKLLSSRRYVKFSAMRHHKHKLRLLAYKWVERVANEGDCSFLYDFAQNEQVIAMIQESLSHFRDNYTDATGFWQWKKDDLIHMTADLIMEGLFHFEPPGSKFHEQQYSQLNEMSGPQSRMGCLTPKR